MEKEKKEEEEMKTEHDIEMEKEAKERAIYGRHWVWEGYFNEKKKDSVTLSSLGEAI